ncbi:MAG: POTRA domain-containing protein, partial [Candidatus Korobacteraceae bacterium]
MPFQAHRRCYSLSWWGLAYALFLLFLVLPASAQDNLISDVDIIGNRRIPAETIRSRIFTKPGDVYDQTAIERDFNSLWNTTYFEDLR